MTNNLKWYELGTHERLGVVKSIYSPNFKVAKLTCEVEGDKPAFFEVHWWKKECYMDASIYISTHSGCPVGCAMCGTNGVSIRPATADEMIAQFETSLQDMKAKNDDLDDFDIRLVKWMYMGEPLLNIHEVDKAMRYIADKYPDWHMLLSTICPRIDLNIIKDLVRDLGSKLWVSFSIHKLDDKNRGKLIPYGDKLTIDEIVTLGEELYEISGIKPSFSVNLFNKGGSEELRDRIVELFDVDKWIPAIQFLYSKTGKEDPIAEKAANRLVDEFVNLLYHSGYNPALGFYGPESYDDWHLQTGCGQFVEFQEYVSRKGL
ncbi:MAG: hypothetical protein ABJG42_24050 [Vibrio splendidus]